MRQMNPMAPKDRSRIIAPICIALLIGLVFAGCLTPTHGEVAVYLRANPTDEFTELELTVSRVEVQRAGAGIGDGQDGSVPEPGQDAQTGDLGITTITASPVTKDLLSFQDPDSRAFLGIDRVAEGTYSQIIVRISEAQGVLREDGSRVDIRLSTTEFREWYDFRVEVEETTRLIVELDLEASISEDEQGYRMRPRVAGVQSEPRAEGSEGDIQDRGG